MVSIIFNTLIETMYKLCFKIKQITNCNGNYQRFPFKSFTLDDNMIMNTRVQ